MDSENLQSKINNNEGVMKRVGKCFKIGNEAPVHDKAASLRQERHIKFGSFDHSHSRR